MEFEKKENIIEVAGKIFNRLGFKKASVDEIAKACGVAKGTIYLAAKNKEDLFYQVLLKQTRLRINELKKLIDPNIGADKLLMLVGDRAIRNFEKYPLMKDLIFGRLKKMIPSLKPKLETLRAISREPIDEILKLGVEQGIFRSDLDLEMIAELLLDLNHSVLLFHMDSKMGVNDWDRRSKASYDLIFAGIKK